MYKSIAQLEEFMVDMWEFQRVWSTSIINLLRQQGAVVNAYIPPAVGVLASPKDVVIFSCDRVTDAMFTSIRESWSKGEMLRDEEKHELDLIRERELEGKETMSEELTQKWTKLNQEAKEAGFPNQYTQDLFARACKSIGEDSPVLSAKTLDEFDKHLKAEIQLKTLGREADKLDKLTDNVKEVTQQISDVGDQVDALIEKIDAKAEESGSSPKQEQQSATGTQPDGELNTSPTGSTSATEGKKRGGNKKHFAVIMREGDVYGLGLSAEEAIKDALDGVKTPTNDPGDIGSVDDPEAILFVIPCSKQLFDLVSKYGGSEKWVIENGVAVPAPEVPAKEYLENQTVTNSNTGEILTFNEVMKRWFHLQVKRNTIKLEMEMYVNQCQARLNEIDGQEKGWNFCYLGDVAQLVRQQFARQRKVKGTEVEYKPATVKTEYCTFKRTPAAEVEFDDLAFQAWADSVPEEERVFFGEIIEVVVKGNKKNAAMAILCGDVDEIPGVKKVEKPEEVGIPKLSLSTPRNVKENESDTLSEPDNGQR